MSAEAKGERCPTHGEPILLAIGDEWCCNACVQARLAALSASRAGAAIAWERLKKFALHADTPAGDDCPGNYGEPCECGLDAALSTASGDVREALLAFYKSAWGDGAEHNLRGERRVDAFLSSLSLPPADTGEAELAEAFAWVLVERGRLLDTRGWEGRPDDAADLARRWIGGERG